MFLYPETRDTLQNDRALAALSSGLLTGRGLFNNRIPVPLSENDFIFSIIGAEFGFLGSLAVLAIFFTIVIRCLLIAHRSQVFLGRLIAVGVGATIGLQTFMHVGVNTFILPNTGINLPFISQGGSAMWVFMGMIGLVLNVGMTREYSMFEGIGSNTRSRTIMTTTGFRPVRPNKR
jgi:rod shape determining protein RodA